MIHLVTLFGILTATALIASLVLARRFFMTGEQITALVSIAYPLCVFISSVLLAFLPREVACLGSLVLLIATVIWLRVFSQYTTDRNKQMTAAPGIPRSCACDWMNGEGCKACYTT